MLDVTDWRVAAEEPAGADEKLWLAHPTSDERWLFKPITIKGSVVHGEDWAEKAASELACALGLPCAQIEVAVRGSQQGAVSRNLRPAGYDMHNGAVLLSGLIDGYIPGAHNPTGRPGHSLENIQTVLRDALPPPNAQLPSELSAFDTFAGMLVLDAWIANRDRHDENWSVLHPHQPDEPIRLCGAYDQAGCLGFNVPDPKRQQMLEAGGVAAWASRGTAWRFEHSGKPPSLVSLAARALELASPVSRAHWIEALLTVTDDTVMEILHRLPVLSDPARSFASEVLKINKERLLHECH
ncbi:HipA domain-containing protein [Blastococcus saxobsidens]|uniref:HipA domain-containing protein n=1 Tax=Blastococcus saxobsidens TaxID=138336 RepID=UPI00140F604D|nr:HipA domain-containing protein [Blastococcus saxobsidens]